jgi:hypothetical protein
MSDNIKVNWIEITKTDVITENHHILNKPELDEASLSTTNNLNLQEELSQLIQNFNKIYILKK